MEPTRDSGLDVTRNAVSIVRSLLPPLGVKGQVKTILRLLRTNTLSLMALWLSEQPPHGAGMSRLDQCPICTLIYRKADPEP